MALDNIVAVLRVFIFSVGLTTVYKLLVLYISS